MRSMRDRLSAPRDSSHHKKYWELSSLSPRGYRRQSVRPPHRLQSQGGTIPKAFRLPGRLQRYSKRIKLTRIYLGCCFRLSPRFIFSTESLLASSNLDQDRKCFRRLSLPRTSFGCCGATKSEVSREKCLANWFKTEFWSSNRLLQNAQSLAAEPGTISVSYTHLRAHETPEHLVCRLLLEKKKK